MNQNLVSVRVWGDYACFTRPEMKVERVSYPLMTPSAARGILEAIFWKPEMFYVIDAIRVVKKGIWTAFRRNEVTKRISLTQAKSAMNGTGEISIIQSDDTNGTRTQRNMLALQCVEYIITAEICLSEIGKGSNQLLPKYKEEMERRVRAGKCFHRPSFGVREFSCDFDWVEDIKDFSPETNWTENFGLMLYDVFSHKERAAGFAFLDGEDYADQTAPLFATEKPKKKKGKILTDGVLVKPSASFFRAEIKDGVMDCHPDRIEIFQKNGGDE